MRREARSQSEFPDNDSVDELKDAIKAKMMYLFHADVLQLLSAKMKDLAWLSSSIDDVKKLKEGEKTALTIK